MTNDYGYAKLTILEFPKFMDAMDKRWVDKIKNIFEKEFTSAEIEAQINFISIVEKREQEKRESSDKYHANFKLGFNDVIYDDIDNYIEIWGLACALLPCFDELNVLYRDPKLGKDDETTYMKVLYTLHDLEGEIEFAAMITEMIPVFSNEEDDSNESEPKRPFNFTCKVNQSDEVKEQAKEILKK